MKKGASGPEGQDPPLSGIVDAAFIALQSALAGEYSLERELGRGGMGIVYLAREVQLDRLVAIKVLRPALASRPDVRARFLREARLAASLSHPNIIQIFRVVEGAELTYLTMQFLDGETLGERLRRRGPMRASDATTMLREVAWALSHAHARNVVHRDIKPDNILLERETGRSLVSDFGIATARDDPTAELEPIMGSAHFMSPEQANRAPVDGRSDLYSLGVVGYLASSGRFPFDGATLGELLAKQATDPAPSLAAVVPTAPSYLVAAIDRCLQIDPAERFASAEAFAEVMQEAALVRPALPADLRAWVDARNPWTAFNAMWFVGCTFLAVTTNAGGEPLALVVMGAQPALLAVVRRARLGARLLGQGYTIADIRIALRTSHQDDGFLAEPRPSGRRTLLKRVFRWSSWATIGGAVTAILGVRLGFGHLLNKDVIYGLMQVSVLSIVAGPALGISLVPKFGDAVRRLRRAFWNSKAGEYAARLLTPKHHATATQFAHRPTEIALGVAAEALFRALPDTYRETVRDLPAVVRRLEGHAQRARTQLSALRAEPGRDETNELALARDAARRELTRAISALESIRLHLLRLHGGLGELQPITTVLDAARLVGEDLDRLVQAQREVGGMSRRLGFESRTPTPA